MDLENDFLKQESNFK